MDQIKLFLLRLGTPFTVGLFMVSAISGIALYFHVGTTYFREMHEVLSMILIAPFVVHVWRNWAPLKNYFRRWTMPVSLAICVIWAGYYAFGSLGEQSSGGNPAFALMAAAQRAPITQLAPVLGIDEATAIKRLSDAGFGAVAPSDNILTVAQRNNAEVMTILAPLMVRAAP